MGIFLDWTEEERDYSRQLMRIGTDRWEQNSELVLNLIVCLDNLKNFPSEHKTGY